jgi:hypothetical protein
MKVIDDLRKGVETQTETQIADTSMILNSVMIQLPINQLLIIHSVKDLPFLYPKKRPK